MSTENIQYPNPKAECRRDFESVIVHIGCSIFQTLLAIESLSKSPQYSRHHEIVPVAQAQNTAYRR